MLLEEILVLGDVLVNFVTKKQQFFFLLNPCIHNIDVVNAMMRSITLENVIFLTV